jgi:cobalt-zinc-cadmium efflux system membrane fusion protein
MRCGASDTAGRSGKLPDKDMLYYLVTTLVFAATLAVTGIVTEVGSTYVARYMVENESQDLGISSPSSQDKPTQKTPDAPARDATRAGGPSAKATTVSSPVMPILISDAELPARLAGPGEDMATSTRPLKGSYRVAALRDGPAGPVDGALSSAPAPETAPAIEPARVPTVLPQSQPRAALDLLRDTPHRRPDGSAFLPMSTQRVFSVRWQVGNNANVAMAYEIPGHVITDPSTGTSVNAPLTGIIESNQGAFAFLGMRVRRGDLLAYLQPIVSVSERAQIQARIEQLSNQISLAEKQMERLGEVLFVRYRPNKIEALKVQIDGYRRELLSLQSALGRREALRASADGVISKVAAVVGGTVAQGQVVFEIVDPDALWVEAAAYDSAIAESIGTATAVTSNGHSFKLEFIGGGLTLSNQAIPLRFRVVGAHDGLSVGKPVTVIVQQKRTVAGIPVPSSSVIRDADGRSIVWERTGAETFMPRQVRATRIAGNQMVVESGLADGARVVTEGASLLNQIR